MIGKVFLGLGAAFALGAAFGFGAAFCLGATLKNSQQWKLGDGESTYLWSSSLGSLCDLSVLKDH